MGGLTGGYTVHQYGSDPDLQFVKLWMPNDGSLEGANGVPVVVVVHGGFWANEYSVENAMQTTLAPYLVGPPRKSTTGCRCPRPPACTLLTCAPLGTMRR